MNEVIIEQIAQEQGITKKQVETVLELLKDVVYTEVYDQRRIDDWSESMHKTVTELAHREIKKDKRLANWAVDHIVESDKTYNLFKGGRKK